MLGRWGLALLLCGSAWGAERTAVKLAFTPTGKSPVEVWITRARAEDGGLTLKLVAKGVGPRPQALTLYRGGGDDDGPGDDDVKGIVGKVVDLPVAGKTVRVDFNYKTDDDTDEEQTETTLVSFGGKTHRVLHLVTRRVEARTPTCREVEETTLGFDPIEVAVTATTRLVAEPALGDDDLPVDKDCKGWSAPRRALYRWRGDKFVESHDDAAPATATPSPSPAPARPASLEESTKSPG